MPCLELECRPVRVVSTPSIARRLGGVWGAHGVYFRRCGGGEDPWLCGPDFRRVCLCRGIGSPDL